MIDYELSRLWTNFPAGRLKIKQIRSHSSQRPDRQNRLMPSSSDHELPQLGLIQHVHRFAFARLMVREINWFNVGLNSNLELKN